MLLIASLMSLSRWVEMSINSSHFANAQGLITNAFIGLRFDLLILSFLLIPLLIFFIFNIQRKTAFFKHLDFVIISCWLFVSGIYFFNYLYLKSHQDLIWNEDWLKAFELLFKSPANEVMGAFLMALILFLIGLHLIKKIRRIMLMAPFRSQVIMLLILAFFARGSIGKDHLRRNDCDGRANSVIRALCLNPVYVFLKVKNQEFGP